MGGSLLNVRAGSAGTAAGARLEAAGRGHFGRFHQQLLDRNLFGEALSQEGIIGRVFQQPADQVGHAGDQLAERRVNPHALAAVGQELRLVAPHAVEHLQLVGSLGHAEVLRAGDAVGEAPQVVAAEGGSQPAIVLHQEPREPLEIGVGLPFLLVDGNGPAVRLGHDRFVVPVGPLHQPHPDRRAALFRPLQEGFGVALRLGQVRLHDDADVGKVAELVLHQNLFEDLEGEVFVGVLLHVDVDVGVVLAGGPQQGTQPLLDVLGRARHVDGAKLAVEGRQFERQIDPRNAAFVIAIEPRHFRPGLHLGRHPLDQVEVALLIRVGVALAGRGFAEQVEREGKPLLAELGDRGQHFLDLRTGDEPLRHAERVRPGVEGQRLAQDRVRLRNLQPQPDGQRQVRANFVKVFLQMAGDGLVRVQHGQDVHEAEHLHLDRLVGHGPRQDAIVPPAALEDRRAPPFQTGEQLPANLLRLGLDGRVEVGGFGPTRSPSPLAALLRDNPCVLDFEFTECPCLGCHFSLST